MPTSASAESERPNGPRSLKGTQTRVRLLEAAKEIFEEDGFIEGRISDIAERAGLSHGSFYHYFDSKEEIFREVAASVEETLVEPLGGVILDPESRATPQDRLREALRRHLESYQREARIIGVIEQMSRYDTEVSALRMERHAALLTTGCRLDPQPAGARARRPRFGSRDRLCRTRCDDQQVPRDVAGPGSRALQHGHGRRPTDPALRQRVGSVRSASQRLPTFGGEMTNGIERSPVTADVRR